MVRELLEPYLVMAMAGILSAVYFGITHTVWAVTGEFTRLGGHLLEFVGVDVSVWAYFELVHMNGTTWTRTDGWIVWGMFIGALITILLSGNFKIRMPRQKRRYVQGFAGGIIAGFGPDWPWAATSPPFYRCASVLASCLDLHRGYGCRHLPGCQAGQHKVVEREARAEKGGSLPSVKQGKTGNRSLGLYSVWLTSR